jgi:hypothetical protein
MKIEKVDLNDVKNTLTRIALMKACENNSHDVLINIYFTKTNDSFNLVTFDAFVWITFHSTLFIVDETLMTKNSRKSVLTANILINDNICFFVFERSIDIVFSFKCHTEMKKMIWWKKKRKKDEILFIMSDLIRIFYIYECDENHILFYHTRMRRESSFFSSHKNVTRIIFSFITYECDEKHHFFHHIYIFEYDENFVLIIKISNSTRMNMKQRNKN